MPLLTERKRVLLKMIISAMMIAAAMVLPLATSQIPEIGKALCPMHLPVMLCGFFCGPWYGLLVGFISPLLRSAIFSAPALLPTAVAMAFELAAYGFFTGLMYRLLPKKKGYIYVSLVSSMVFGRIIWGIAMKLLTFAGIKGYDKFGFTVFFADAFAKAVPGLILQLVAVPLIVMAIQKAFPDIREL